MLVNFKVKNFRSFKEKVEFSMEAAAEIVEHRESHVRNIGGYDLLKSAVLFGANASGKSNFVKALASLYLLITEPTKDANESLIANTFFGNSQNISYQIEFIKNSKHFCYELEVNVNEVVVEKLFIDDKLYFERQKQKFVKIPEKIDGQVENIRCNQLLIFFAQSQNDPDAIDAYTWFNQDLIFANFGRQQISDIKDLMSNLKNNKFKEKFLAFLKYADFSITNVDVLDNIPKLDEVSARNYPIWLHIITTHIDEDGKEFRITMLDESEGTQEFVLIALQLMFKNLDKGKVLIFDEFNRSLHQELSQAVLHLINSEKQINQFILTTHELSLISNNLRRDQIYFTEKNQNGSTDIYSLYDFDDTEICEEDIDHKMRYLAGSYGAIPIISTVVLESILEEDDDV